MKTILRLFLIAFAATAHGASILFSSGIPSQVGNAGKFLTTNGSVTSWASLAGGGDAVVANSLAQFAPTTSAELKGVLTDELGDAGGKVIFSLGRVDISVGKTLTSLATLTLTGTDGSTFNVGTGGTLGTAAYTAASAYQPIDADLTTFAGITPSANIQTLLSAADFAAARTSLGLVIGTNVQAFDADLTTYAGITPSVNVQTLLGSATFAAFGTSLFGADPNADRIVFWDDSASGFAYLTAGTGLTISGTTISVGDLSATYQPLDADLTTYAGIAPSANIQTLLGSVDFASARTSLGLAIGTNVQAFDADLTTYAGITPSANVQTLLGAANFTAFKTSLTLDAVENTALSSWAGSGSITQTGTVTSGTWSGALDGTVTMSLGSDATGDVYYRNASGFLTRLAKSTDGKVLKLLSGIPSWEDDNTAGSPTFDTIGDPSGNGTIAFANTIQVITSTLDNGIVLELTNTDADLAADTTLLKLSFDDGADTNGIYLSMIGDKDGTPTTDFQFHQTLGFTSLLPVNVPAEPYDKNSWNGDTGAPRKDDVRDQFEIIAPNSVVSVGTGGTGLTVGTSGGVLAFSATNQLVSSGLLAANALVIGGGAGIAPSTTTTGTGVLTALGVNTGSAGSFVVNGGVLGTPSSGTLTNATGLPISSGVSGLGANVATFLGTASSANLASAVSDETGSGVLVFGTSPVFTTKIQLPTAAGASTLTTGGDAAYDTTNKKLGIYNGTKEVALSTIYHQSWTFDPKAVCDGTVDRLLLMSTDISEPFGIHIVKWKLSFSQDPGTELAASALMLKRADAFISVANAANMDDLATTAGASSEATSANINGDAVVANGKVIYLQFDTAYTAANEQIVFEMWWEVEED